MKLLLTLSLILLHLIVIGQTRQKSLKPSTPTLYGGYKDVAVLDSTIWAVDVNGQLGSYTSTGEERPISTTIKTPITSIHVAGKSELVVVCGQNIYLLNSKTQAFTYEAKLPLKTVFLARDNRKQIWAATETGLLNVSTQQAFVPDSTLNHYYKWRPEPSASLLDSNNILWLGFNMGEWGGNLQVFDTNSQRFVPVSFTDTLAQLSPVNTFCQIGSQVYLSGAVAHGYTSSCITRFDRFQARHVFNSGWKENFRTVAFGSPEGEYIRALAYHPAEGYCYYYSQSGLFKGRITANLSEASSWQLVWTPDWPGKTSQHDSSKMAFTSDNKLVILVRNGALGIWDGRVFHLVP